MEWKEFYFFLNFAHTHFDLKHVIVKNYTSLLGPVTGLRNTIMKIFNNNTTHVFLRQRNSQGAWEIQKMHKDRQTRFRNFNIIRTGLITDSRSYSYKPTQVLQMILTSYRFWNKSLLHSQSCHHTNTEPM